MILGWIFVIGRLFLIHSGLRGAVKPSDHLFGNRPEKGKAGASERRAYVLMGLAIVVAGASILFHHYR